MKNIWPILVDPPFKLRRFWKIFMVMKCTTKIHEKKVKRFTSFVFLLWK